MDFKPTEGQRTTTELLQYISILVPATIEMILKNDAKVFNRYEEESKTVTPENFLETMDSAEKKMKDMLARFDDAELATVVNIYNMGENSKGVYLVETILRWLTAYTLQLFLYIKASGNTSIGTMNLWAGMDTPDAQ